METAPFACGICAEKFEKLGKFYMHLGEHNVLIQKEFHVCNEEVSSETQEISWRKKRSSNKRVNNGGKEDSASTTALYICKVCSCTFSTLCVLHNHIGRCFGGRSYVFDADQNSAYPIKSICSFFEARNDIHYDADITSNNSDCDTVIYEPGESPEHDGISLERDDNGKTILCVKEEPSDAINFKNNIVVKSEKSKVKKRVSKRKSEQISSEDKSVKSNEEKTQKTLNQCLICEKVFERPKRLKDHQFIHTKERAFKCELCPKAFCSVSGWRDHRYSHNTELPYSCEICGERFPVIRNLNRHIKRKHAKEKPHKCKTCGAAFVQRSGLTRHELQHTEERQYQCEVCGIGFTQPAYLERHKLAKHDKEKGKRFPCDQCKRRFVTNYQLQCHLKVHTGERPFPCKLCKSAYIQRKELQRHMKTRHGLTLDGMVVAGQIKCTENWEDERPHRCKLCTAAYKRIKELRIHLNIQHGLKLETMDIPGEIERHRKLKAMVTAAEKDDKAFQTGRIAELPGEVVEDNTVRNQSNVYEDMDTQSTDYQIEETQSAVGNISVT